MKVAITVLLPIWTIVAAQFCASCVSSSDFARGVHEGLNVLTDVVDPSYALAFGACDARESVVIARGGTTEAEDRAALEQIRSQCGRIYTGFETVRQAQLVAREAADLASNDAELLPAALAAFENVKHAWEALRAVLGESGFELPEGDE